jgi:dihydrodipicolinate synthase/N-acetylneuraminate lyase
LCTDIFNAVRDGRFDDAKAMHRRLAPLSKLVGAQYGVPGLKAAITLCGFEGGHPRPPLQPVPQAAVDAIRAALAELNLLETSDVAR